MANPSIAYLNGQFLPLDQAQVSVMDRGFLFGDGVYEVIPVFNGQLFRYGEHMLRLKNSLAAIGLTLDFAAKLPYSVFKQLVALNQGNNQSLYLQVTRGSNLERNLVFPASIDPTIFAFCAPLPVQPIAVLAKGCSAITLTDIRWQQCNTKAITLLANVLLRNQAAAQQAAEAILIRDDYALEGASSNLFIVKNNTLITPPLSHALLGGITRELIIELAAAHGMPCLQADIPVAHLRQAQEIWITASGKEILPVLHLDGKPVGAGTPGPLWYQMIEYYQAYKRTYHSD